MAIIGGILFSDTAISVKSLVLIEAAQPAQLENGVQADSPCRRIFPFFPVTEIFQSFTGPWLRWDPTICSQDPLGHHTLKRIWSRHDEDSTNFNNMWAHQRRCSQLMNHKLRIPLHQIAGIQPVGECENRLMSRRESQQKLQWRSSVPFCHRMPSAGFFCFIVSALSQIFTYFPETVMVNIHCWGVQILYPDCSIHTDFVSRL